MSTFFLYTSPARGHLYPMMDVALELRSRGHRVVVQTLADERDAVEAAGVEHRPIDPRIEALPLEDWQGANPLAALRHTLARWSARAAFEVDDVRRSVEELAPDVILTDANALGACAAAEVSGTRWASHLPYVLPVPSRDAPAFGPGFPPPAGWFDRLRDDVVWKVQGLAGAGALTPLRALRASLGAAPFQTFSDLFRLPPLLLHRTAVPLEYPRSDWPANVRHVGPGLWAPLGAAPEWLAESAGPRTLVSISTEHQDDGAIVDAAMAAFVDAPGTTIITTAAVDPGRFRPPGAHIRVERFLPHPAVLPYVDLVVTHGGMGTTQRALASGVPLVVVPWGRDQLETAQRVVRCGAGVAVSKSKLSADSLRNASEQARLCREGARRVAAAFAAAGGAPEAANLLERL